MDRVIPITIEVDETVFKMLNNAVAALGDIYWGAIMGTNIPSKFEGLKEKTDSELISDFNALVDIYKKIEHEYLRNK